MKTPRRYLPGTEIPGIQSTHAVTPARYEEGFNRFCNDLPPRLLSSK